MKKILAIDDSKQCVFAETVLGKDYESSLSPVGCSAMYWRLSKRNLPDLIIVDCTARHAEMGIDRGNSRQRSCEYTIVLSSRSKILLRPNVASMASENIF